MSLTSGAKLGSYEILAAIGAGGMGEVYRAWDSKLRRDVALKVLPEAFARETERLTRLHREAQVLASLSHPNIAAIYGFEDSGSTHALVMELVEGPALADRIKSGAIPQDEALPIAKQIAEALEYAHERGIVHRDLKPANIKLAGNDTVKILDFGLAKAMEGEAASADLSNSPTLSAMATRAGFLLGTAAYMSPEQAKGKTVDRRTDIWAFGCVLYEMLTGKLAFSGETVSDTLAAVIRAEPDWSQLPSCTPPAIHALLRRCLKKDPRQRLQAIGDARITIEEVLCGAPQGPESSTAGTRPAPAYISAFPWLLSAFLAIALVTAFLFFPSNASKPEPPLRLNIALPPGWTFQNNTSINLAISRDGTKVAYVLRGGGSSSQAPQIWLRNLGDFAATPVPGTEGADTPFFSPDGQWLGFYLNQKIQTVSLSGGLPQAICDSSGPYGATWGTDGEIYFGDEFTGLFRAPSSGGERERILAPDKDNAELGLIEPQILPGGQALLITVVKRFSVEQSSIAVLSLKTAERKILLQNATSPHYVSPGYIVFARSGTLWAAPFDSKLLKLTGEAIPLVSGVANHSGAVMEQFDLSNEGKLVYAPGAESEAQRSIVELDRSGNAHTVTTQALPYEDLSLSPDGHRLAVTVEGIDWNIWVYDLDAKALRRLTFENDNRDPFWSADGKSIVYTSLRNGQWGLYEKAADGTGSEKTLFRSPEWTVASSFSPDNRSLIFFHQTTGESTWVLPLENGGKPYLYLQGPFAIWFPKFSPDGRWVAYESTESGRHETYVQSFSGAAGKWQISNEGGARPVWPSKSKELFYLKDNALMAVPVQTSPVFSYGTPRKLFQGDFKTSGQYYDASPDGQHFYFIKESGPAAALPQINCILGLGSDLERR
jgi:eukaryotic-like serine/threonine-protein kinase